MEGFILVKGTRKWHKRVPRKKKKKEKNYEYIPGLEP